MLVSIIAAVDSRGLIGNEAGLPWHLPADLRRFRACTWGKPVIMGRTTFELIGKPLPGRFNIVLTRNPEKSIPGCRMARTLREALSIAEDFLVSAGGVESPPRVPPQAATGGDEVMIIGGGQVYAEAIHLWDRLYLTVVEGQFEGDTYFPVRELLRQTCRRVGEPVRCPADEKNRYAHSFHILERAGGSTLRSEGEKDDRTPACENPQDTLHGADLAALLTLPSMDS